MPNVTSEGQPRRRRGGPRRPRPRRGVAVFADGVTRTTGAVASAVALASTSAVAATWIASLVATPCAVAETPSPLVTLPPHAPQVAIDLAGEPTRHPTATSRDADALHVDLDLVVLLVGDPEDPDPFVAGKMTLTVALRRHDLEILALDLDDALTVDDVLLNGEPTGFVHTAADQLLVDLAPPAVGASPVEITVSYHGTPVEQGFGSFAVREHEGTPVIQTVSQPIYAHTWWPCIDRPDDKFTVDLHYTVPDWMTAVASGVLVGVDDPGDGTRTFHWRESTPIASYLVSLAATDYVRIDDVYDSSVGPVPITHYVFPEDSLDAVASFSNTPAMMAVFADHFGEYPFADEKYGMAAIRFLGGMEHQTLTSIGSGLIDGTHANDPIFAHELAHQWWGNCVTPRNLGNIWISEGFATYAEALWDEHEGGLDAYLAFFRARDWLTFHGTVYAPPLDPPVRAFSVTTYVKGAYVLHMLRYLLGDEDFFAIFPLFRSRHEYGNATTRDFIDAAEHVSGTELDWFFDQWLRREGRPAYAASFTQDGGTATVTVTQTHDGDPYRMPLPLRIHTSDGPVDVTVENASREASYGVPVTGIVDSVTVDPDGWILDEPPTPAPDDLIWATLADPRQHCRHHAAPLRIPTHDEIPGRDPARRTEFGPVVDAVVAAMDEATFTGHVSRLSGAEPLTVDGVTAPIQTRFTGTDGLERALAYAESVLVELGWEVRRHGYLLSGQPRENLVARKPGTTRPREIVVLGGHLDSISETPTTLAPGAEDNASGSSGVLTAAAALAPHAFDRTLELVLFTGEEQGLHGSTAYVTDALAGMNTIVAAITFDMIANWETDRGVLIEGAARDESLLALVGDAVDRYTSIDRSFSFFPFGSDHVPFIDRGIPAMLAIDLDWDEYAGYHRTTDVFANVEPDLGIAIARAGTAAAAQLALLTPLPGLRAYPNPAGQHVVIRFPEEAVAREVAIYDITGREVHRLTVTGREGTWDLRDGRGHRVPSGRYWIRSAGMTRGVVVLAR